MLSCYLGKKETRRQSKVNTAPMKQRIKIARTN